MWCWGDGSQHLKGILGNTNWTTQRHIPQGMNPQQYCCRNLTPWIYLWFNNEAVSMWNYMAWRGLCLANSTGHDKKHSQYSIRYSNHLQGGLRKISDRMSLSGQNWNLWPPKYEVRMQEIITRYNRCQYTILWIWIVPANFQSKEERH
jgi:hypothetical protein